MLGQPMCDPAAQPDLLVCRGVTKRFGPTTALDDVSVSFRAGEVHALMGENGAGKSTLGKAIAGLHRPDAGTISILRPGAGGGDGGGGGYHELRPGSIDDAFDHGVRIVHQELAQCPNLSVAENLCLHAVPRTRLGTVDFGAMARRAEHLLAELEPGIDVRAPLGELAPGHRQIVQIAASLDDGSFGKARLNGEAPVRPANGGAARVIVFDEPTSSLSIAEVERLLGIVRQLAAAGITVIYVSHRMGEIFSVCDRVTVLRDGKFVATSRVRRVGAEGAPGVPPVVRGGTGVPPVVRGGTGVPPVVRGGTGVPPVTGEAGVNEAELVEQMIGRRLDVQAKRLVAPEGANGGAAALLEIRDLTSPGKVEGVSLGVRSGEILGIGGLVGSGRSELLDAVFGLEFAAGNVRVGGREIPPRSPRAMIDAGVGYVPEDRKLQGLFFELGIDENIVVPQMARLGGVGGLFGVRNFAGERSLAGERMAALRVKAASAESVPGSLSGGNQQKLLIARWLGRDTKVLLLDEPTRGIDVGTKVEIYRLIREAADRGLAVLLVSSEMPELLALSDRIVVMAGGRVRGELTGDEMTQTNILRLATR
jgi:ABC-type sugar transport system ATPase subunit